MFGQYSKIYSHIFIWCSKLDPGKFHKAKTLVLWKLLYNRIRKLKIEKLICITD